MTISVAPESGSSTVVVVGTGLIVVVVVGATESGDELVDAIVVVVAAIVVVVSKTCAGAPARRALPRKIAKMAFMFSPVRRGSMTALPFFKMPMPST